MTSPLDPLGSGGGSMVDNNANNGNPMMNQSQQQQQMSSNMMSADLDSSMRFLDMPQGEFQYPTTTLHVCCMDDRPTV